MNVSLLKKVVVAVLVPALSIPVVAASAATPATKKISVSQGKKIYDNAVKATNAWLAKTPHTTVYRSEEGSDNGKRVNTENVTIDGNSNLLSVENGIETYLIGETLYTRNDLEDLTDTELAIAEDLGLALDAKYAALQPLLVYPEYPFDALRAAYREVADVGFTGSREGAKTTTVTYRKTGKTEILTVTLSYAAKKGYSAEKRVLSYKIERGIIVASTATTTSVDGSYKTTTTNKPYTGTITAPAGPYLELDRIYQDPRYGKATDTQAANARLYSYIREALAYAAFDGLDKLTIDIWKLVAEDWEDVVVYDKGIEFAYGPDNNKRACGVYTDEGAYLEKKTCEELGFTKI